MSSKIHERNTLFEISKQILRTAYIRISGVAGSIQALRMKTRREYLFDQRLGLYPKSPTL